MLKISKTENAAGRWIDYTDGVAFKVRPLTGTVLRDLRKQVSTIRMAPDPKSGKFVPFEEIDDEKFNDIMSDYLLEDYRGIGDETGEVLAVTLENKKLILNQIALKDYIWNAAQALDFEEAKVKN